jgi:hypothetical protein
VDCALWECLKKLKKNPYQSRRILFCFLVAVVA